MNVSKYSVAALAALLFAAPAVIQAQSWEGYVITPHEIGNTTTYTITIIGYDGFGGPVSGAVWIPSTISVPAIQPQPLPVTSIAESAFFDCPNMTSVIIPSSVTTIAEWAFQDCPNLKQIYFTGSPPSLNGSYIFENDPATVYYLPGTGWPSTFSDANLPTVLWNPVIQTSVGSFGVSNNQFGFNITGTTNIPISVVACTNLASPVWIPVTNVFLTNGLFYFSEPMQTNDFGRFYGISPQ